MLKHFTEKILRGRLELHQCRYFAPREQTPAMKTGSVSVCFLISLLARPVAIIGHGKNQDQEISQTQRALGRKPECAASC
jgi:hypothetical protein